MHNIFPGTVDGERSIKMKIEITNPDTKSKVLVDDSLTLDEIKASIPGFFTESNTRFFGDNRYVVYKGQLIVDGTMVLSDHKARRKITVYLCILDYLTAPDKGRGFDTLHLGWPSDLEEAERLIDYCLTTKQQYYGMQVPDNFAVCENCGEACEYDTEMCLCPKCLKESEQNGI
jgi:hypothetical protein